jgi:hypothetical protein
MDPSLSKENINETRKELYIVVKWKLCMPCFLEVYPQTRMHAEPLNISSTNSVCTLDMHTQLLASAAIQPQALRPKYGS